MTIARLCVASALALLFTGCGGGTIQTTTPELATVPPDAVNATLEAADSTLSGNEIGELTFQMDASGVPTVNFTEITRNGQFPVSTYSPAVSVQTLSTQYLSEHRVWALTMAFTNHTAVTVYGPWIAYFDLGGSVPRNLDGYASLNGGGDSIFWPGGGQVKPINAFAKENPGRAWYGGTTLTTTIYIQLPPGLNHFNGLKAYLDIEYPGQRSEPIVEGLQLYQCIDPNECAFALTAVIADWQAFNLPLEAYAVYDDGGQQQFFPMVDDGTGKDQVAGDHVYTGILPKDPRTTSGRWIAAIAYDFEGRHFYNGGYP